MKEALIHATMQKNLKNTMLSKRSKIQRATYYMIPVLQNCPNRQIHRGRRKIGRFQRLRGESMQRDY
jgi:hypothetical protein